MTRPTLRLLGALLVTTLALAGCGRVSGSGAAPIPSPSVAKVEASMPLDQAPGAAYGMTAGTGGGIALGAPSAVGACEALAGCNVHAQLVVGTVDKKKVGFLWRKLKVKGQITNRGAAALSGEIMIRFKKSGSVVQSEYVAIASLAPGQNQAFETSSSVAADDCEVTTRAL